MLEIAGGIIVAYLILFTRARWLVLGLAALYFVLAWGLA